MLHRSHLYLLNEIPKEEDDAFAVLDFCEPRPVLIPLAVDPDIIDTPLVTDNSPDDDPINLGEPSNFGKFTVAPRGVVFVGLANGVKL